MGGVASAGVTQTTSRSREIQYIPFWEVAALPMSKHEALSLPNTFTSKNLTLGSVPDFRTDRGESGGLPPHPPVLSQILGRTPIGGAVPMPDRLPIAILWQIVVK